MVNRSDGPYVITVYIYTIYTYIYLSLSLAGERAMK